MGAPAEELIAEALDEGGYAVEHKPFEVETVLNMFKKARSGAFLMVADDDPNICKTMKTVFERRG